MNGRALGLSGIRSAVVLGVLGVALFATVGTASALPLPGTISGSVVDSASGDPIANVGVAAYVWNGSAWAFSAQANTDMAGNYLLTQPPGDYQLLFKGPAGYAWKAHSNGQWYGYPGATTISVASGGLYTIDARLAPAAIMTVKATTEATGGTIPGAVGNFLVSDLESGFWASTWFPNALAFFWSGRSYEVNVQETGGLAQTYYRNAAGSTVWRSVVGTNTVPLRVRHLPSTYHDAIRKWGATRWQTSVTDSWENTTSPSSSMVGWRYVTDVVIASGDDAGAADALSASGLAGAFNVDSPVPGAPLLLVTKSTLNTEIRNALLAMPDSVDVHIVGGPATVSDTVKNQIDALPNVHEVDRVWGADRYKTATAVATRMVTVLGAQGEPAPDTVLIANGADPAKFMDALALSPVAWRKHAPILLVGKDALPVATRDALAVFSASKRYMAGGTGTISEATRRASGVAPGNRLWGADRYSTATSIATKAVTAGWVPYSNVGVAVSRTDALSGGVSIAQTGGVLLLTSTAKLPTATSYWIEHMPPSGYAFVYGSTASIPETQRLQIQALIN